ncbi:MAG: hypothetical protein U1F98_04055 [Verrucomicrobiota bacterium]
MKIQFQKRVLLRPVQWLCTRLAAGLLAAAMPAGADPAEWRLIVVGDSPGDPTSATGVSPDLAAIAQAIALEQPAPDFVLFPGDLISDINIPGVSPSLGQQYTNWLAAMAPIYNAGIHRSQSLAPGLERIGEP